MEVLTTTGFSWKVQSVMLIVLLISSFFLFMSVLLCLVFSFFRWELTISTPQVFNFLLRVLCFYGYLFFTLSWFLYYIKIIGGY